MKKRIFSMLLTLVMVLSLTPTAVLAKEDHKHCICGVADEGHDHGSIQKWLALNESNPNIFYEENDNTTAYVYLTSDYNPENDIIVPEDKTLNLCLNGHVLNGTGTSSVIKIEANATLNLCDCNGSESTHKFMVSDEEGKEGLWVLDEENGTKNVTGGVITGGKNENSVGGGVNNNGGSFTMYGGNIVGNIAYEGGGVYVEGGFSQFIMHNGRIIGNLVSNGGGGVYNHGGEFMMFDGEISDNIASGEALYGGGVFNYGSGNFEMSGGIITRNSMLGDYSCGGGVCNEGTFTMSGGSITGNTASGVDCYAGGVYNDDTFNLTGEVNISGNTIDDKPSNISIFLEYEEVDEEEEEVIYNLFIGEDFNTVNPIGIHIVEQLYDEEGEYAGLKFHSGIVASGKDEYTLKQSDSSKFVADNAEEFKVEFKSGEIWLTEKTGGSGNNPGGSHSGGGSGSSSGSGKTITVPVSSDSSQVQTQAVVNGSEAIVKQPDSEKLESMALNGEVVFDLTGLGSKIESVKLPTDTLNQIAEANKQRTDDDMAMSVKLSTGVISFDATAINAVVEQTDGTELRLVLDDAGTQNLNAAQKESVKELDVCGVMDAYLVNVKTNERVSDFKGGVVTLSVPYEIPVGTIAAGYTVWYLDESGKMTKHSTWHKDDWLYWTTGHLSDYVIIYDGDAAVTQFEDVPANAYFYDAVLWAAKNDITGGTDSTHFSPNWDTTRAQMVTFLWRANGCPEPASTTCAFTDIKADAYYYKAVLWATENGYTLGTSETTFSPDVTVTRAQAVTFLWRIDGKNAQNGVNSFADVAQSQYYYNAVLWAAENGITEGTGATTFSPNNGCTRAQIVTFLYRYFVK